MSTIAPVAPREKSAREKTATQRVDDAVSQRNLPGARGWLLIMALFAASLWYLWLGARGFWTHAQEPAVSGIQIGVAILACVMALSNAACAGWVLLPSAAALAGLGALGVQLLRQQPPSTVRGWLAVGFSALCLHYLWQWRSRYGHSATIRPFQPAEPVRGGLMEIVTGAARRENALIALNNAIAEAGSISAVPETVLASMAEAGGFSLEKDLSADAAWLYRSYLAAIMADLGRAAGGPGELARLAAELRLKPEVVKEAHARVGGALYQAQLATATADHSLDDAEKVRLAELQSRLSLSDKDVAQIQSAEQGGMLEELYREVSGHPDGLTADGQARLMTAIAQVGAGAVPQRLAESIYRDRLKNATKDGSLDAGERASIDALKGATGLNDATARRLFGEAATRMVRAVFDEVNGLGGITAEGQERLLAVVAQVSAENITAELGPSIYRARVEHVVKDGAVPASERASLDQLQAALGLSDATAKSIRQEMSRSLIQATVDRVANDGQLDDAEARELADLATRLGVDLRADQRNRETLDNARAVWQIAHGQLPVVETGANLDAGEVCHAERAAKWKDWRRIDYGTRYQTETSVRHVKGFLGPYDKVDTETREIHDVRTELRTIDTGRVVVTNHGIIWIGENRNRSWSYGDLVDVTLDGDELVLHVDGDDNVSLRVEGETRLFGMIIGRAMQDA